MLNGSQTGCCRASGCVIIKGRGWNGDDKKKWQLCVRERHVGVHFQYMSGFFVCVFVHMVCAGGCAGLVGGVGVKVKVSVCSRWQNGRKPTHTVTLIKGGSGKEENRGEKREREWEIRIKRDSFI